jgi:hypothetical protein
MKDWLIEEVWKKIPPSVRLWAVLLIAARLFVDYRVWEIIGPLRASRDMELQNFKDKQIEIAADVKVIKNYILYGVKPDPEK